MRLNVFAKIGCVTKYKRLSASNTFIVESVRDLVTDDDANSAIVEGRREVLAVKQWLKNSGRKY